MGSKSMQRRSGYPYRVFISYPHETRVAQILEILRDHLVKLGVCPICDINITAGIPFSDEIRRMIATAHVFMPIVTRESAEGPWVNQEIGYALGLGVPMIPIAIDELPQGMTESIQALRFDDALTGLEEKLTAQDLSIVIMVSRHTMRASYICTEGLYRRTDLMAEKAEDLLVRGVSARVRQRSAFSSFSLPDFGPRHAAWDAREGHDRRDLDVRERLRAERQVMEAHAREAGCDLILDPYVAVPSEPTDRNSDRILVRKHASEGMRLRLRLLIDFLESMPPEQIRVGIHRGRIESSLVLAGDWFAMEAVVPHYGGGYRHSTFTEHGPSVLRKIEEFDDEMEHVLADQDIQAQDSRDHAVAEIRKILDSIES